MPEFIPKNIRPTVSRIKTRTAYNINAVSQNNFGRIQPKSRRTDTTIEDLSRDGIFPGPPLRFNRQKYLIEFRELKENSVDSVEKIWRQNYNKAYNRMKCWVQIVSTPTADTPGTTLLLHFDSKRYLIGNVAEGTQRAAMQRKLGLAKVSDIFLTGPTRWGSVGGLLGMILTLADSTSSSREQQKKQKPNSATEEEKQWLNIHGGKNLTHMLATARRFVFRKGMPVYTKEYRTDKDVPRRNWDPTWKDDMINVWAMVIAPEVRHARKRSHEEFSEGAPSTTDHDGTQEDIEDRRDQMRKSVVASMFASEWRLDALVETKLSQVKLPAAIFVRNTQGRMEKYSGPLPEPGSDFPDIDVLVRNPWPGAMIESLPSTTPSANAVSYIFKNHPQRGKFNPAEAIKLGVKAGPSFRDLTSGKNVTTENGSIVTPDMVLSKGTDGSGFAVVELPDTSYVGPLISREEWSSKEVMHGVHAVVWILGPGVVEDSRLQKFMQDHATWEHIVSSPDCCSNYIALESPAVAAIRLHLLDSERFPIPVHSNVVPMVQKTDAVASPSRRPYQNARVGKNLQLAPTFVSQDDQIISYLDTAKVLEEENLPNVLELAEIARKAVTCPEYQAKLDEKQKDIPSKDAEVVTLGTGSAMPSKYRNVSATMVRVPGYGNYLFDCGENTLGQLKRVFGKDLPEVLRELKVIWISHLHADHHLGTTAVIKAWNEETKNDELTKSKKLMVASDVGMLNWLREYSEVEDYGHDRIHPVDMGPGYTSKSHKQRFTLEETADFGLTYIQSCLVDHCHRALAVAFNFPNGFKVAYSGDCRPSAEFVKIGAGATLLIHEATFDDELEGDAIAKKHSTTSEALRVGTQMNARRILLTHFSQRYQKFPVMDKEGDKDQVAIMAFDYMRVKLEDFAKVEAFKPAMMKLYETKDD